MQVSLKANVGRFNFDVCALIMSFAEPQMQKKEIDPNGIYANLEGTAYTNSLT